MKMKCLDVVTGVSKAGRPFTNGAFRATGKSGNPFLFVASCPPEFKAGQELDCNVAFTQSGNYILPY